MKPYKSISLGYTDAINFALRNEKKLLNNVFLKVHILKKLLVLQLRECPAYTLLYQFSPKDTGQSKVK